MIVVLIKTLNKLNSEKEVVTKSIIILNKINLTFP